MLDFNRDKPIIGVVHMEPLPGSPDFDDMDTVLTRALEDAKDLEKGGIDGLIIENFGDKPFKRSIGKLPVSAFTRVVDEIKNSVDLPTGVNVLRNDWKAALSISKVLELDFIRVNVYTGMDSTCEGLIEGKAAEIQRFKTEHDVSCDILADIQVKHGKKIYPKDIEIEALEATERGLADGVIVSGDRTGEAVRKEQLESVQDVIDRPVLIGSGLDLENISDLLPHSDGAIIGTYLKMNGSISNPVSRERVKKIMQEAEDIR